MRGPLSLRLNDGTVDKHVSLDTTGLRYSKTAYGGHKDLSCLVRTSTGTFADLGGGDEARLYDGRTGATLWQGNIDHPGVTSGPAGEAYELHAFGGGARLGAKRQALAYVLTGLDNWVKSKNTTKGAQVDTASRGADDEIPALQVSWNKGFNIDDNDLGEWRLRALDDAGLKLARVSCSVDAGINASGYKQRIMTGTSVASLSLAADTPAATAASTLVASIASGISSGDDVAALRAIRTGGDVNAAKADWFQFWNIAVRQQLLTAAGAAITTGYGASTVLASEVARDMIGRGMAPGADPAKVSIDTTSFAIDSLAWLDGITFADAMNDLLVFEPDLFWMLEDDRLTVALWNEDEPRYTISPRDGGIVRPGSDYTKCNRVLVSWTDRAGKEQTTVRETTVEGLDYTRDAEPVQLPEGFGTTANANRAGDQVLAAANRRPRAGTAVVRRPIRDQWTGFDVMPWEIEPGCCVTDQERGEVLRLTDLEYEVEAGTATLTLDKPPRTTEQIVARLDKASKRRRH